MSYDVVVRFATPVAMKTLTKTFLALHGFRDDRGGLSWTCTRKADDCAFTVEARGVDRGAVPELGWSVRWGGSRDEILVFAGAITEIAEKHGGTVVLVSGDGASVAPAAAFERIVADWTKAGVGVGQALASLPALGLVPVDERTATRIRVGQLVAQLGEQAESESAREDLEALGAEAIFEALEHEKDERGRRALGDVLSEMGESVAELMARLVPLDALVARVHDDGSRSEAEEALRSLGDRAVDALFEAYLRETDDGRRVTLELTLEEVSGKDAADLMMARVPLATLVALVHDLDNAADALERIGAPAVEAIFDAYDAEPDRDRRFTLADVLERLGGAPGPRILELLRKGGSRRRLELPSRRSRGSSRRSSSSTPS